MVLNAAQLAVRAPVKKNSHMYVVLDSSAERQATCSGAQKERPPLLLSETNRLMLIAEHAPTRPPRTRHGRLLRRSAKLQAMEA